ncbi:hypothetical protein H7171_01130 [Candidatus Saccharibacteria bacterium]|nr:hypothetical protein [Candidatus Saccharibacteria bacterium]
MKPTTMTNAIAGVRNEVFTVAVFNASCLAFGIFPENNSVMETTGQLGAGSITILALGGLAGVVKNRFKSE